MPVEFRRTTKRKRISLASGNPDTDYVDVKVITHIGFKDKDDRGYETKYTVTNDSSDTNRKVHVDTLYSGNGTTPGTREDGTKETPEVDGLPVERVDVWRVLDKAESGQKTHIAFDNTTGGDSVPPAFTAHFKTHVFRYFNPKNPDLWIDVEWIDAFHVLDKFHSGQRTWYKLNNPKGGSEEGEADPAGQADPSDENIAVTDGSLDPPWRLDPFQNIIDFNLTQDEFMFVVAPTWTAEASGSSPTPGGPPLGGIPPDWPKDGCVKQEGGWPANSGWFIAHIGPWAWAGQGDGHLGSGPQLPPGATQVSSFVSQFNINPKLPRGDGGGQGATAHPTGTSISENAATGSGSFDYPDSQDNTKLIFSGGSDSVSGGAASTTGSTSSGWLPNTGKPIEYSSGKDKGNPVKSVAKGLYYCEGDSATWQFMLTNGNGTDSSTGSGGQSLHVQVWYTVDALVIGGQIDISFLPGGGLLGPLLGGVNYQCHGTVYFTMPPAGGSGSGSKGANTLMSSQTLSWDGYVTVKPTKEDGTPYKDADGNDVLNYYDPVGWQVTGTLDPTSDSGLYSGNVVVICQLRSEEEG